VDLVKEVGELIVPAVSKPWLGKDGGANPHPDGFQGIED